MPDRPEKKSLAENGVEWASCDGGDIFHGSSEEGSDIPPIQSAEQAWSWIAAQAQGHGMFVFWLRAGAQGRVQILAANGMARAWQIVPVDDGLVIAPESSDLLR